MRVALAPQATVLLTGRGKPTKLAMLVDTLADPVDPRIVADRVVSSIYKDDLIVLVG